MPDEVKHCIDLSAHAGTIFSADLLIRLLYHLDLNWAYVS